MKTKYPTNMIHKLFTKREVHYKSTLLLALLFLVSFSYAQVGVGNTNPQAALDITASNQASPSNEDGILIPRVDDFPATDPTAAQNGMLIYLTTTVGPDTKGFYYWDNAVTDWIRFSSIERLNDLSDGKSDVGGATPGSSIFIGIDAGLNDDGNHNQNVGVGFNALMTNVSGDANSAFGFQALTLSTTGLNNSAFGFRSLATNSTGRRNSAYGRGSLEGNTTGSFNTALGTLASASNTAGGNNVAIGDWALFSNVTGGANTAVGKEALYTNTAAQNTAVGFQASYLNAGGEQNTSVGYRALYSNVSGENNSAFGHGALNSSTGNNNSAFGVNALSGTTTGTSNVAIGANAGSGNTTGEDNVLIGFNSGLSLTGGIKNVFIGKNTGRDATGSNNIFIGDNAGLHNSFDTVDNTLVIQNASGPTPLIYGEFDNDIVRVNGELQVADPSGTGFAFPTIDGTADQILVTDGAGQLTFEDQAPDVSMFPIIRATLSANQALTATGSQKIAFDTVGLNPTGSTEFNTTANEFVAASTGVYRIDASFHSTTSQTNTEYYGIVVHINGTPYQEYSVNHYYNGTDSSQVARQISCVANVTFGQSIEVYVINNQTGVTLDSSSTKTHVTIQRVR
ncbi:hypothetical protein [Winogradskyella sp. 4-2091]|uniref:hypothetical protein n=1 Tax=Winogradskyella sp. 4-2091 TaxID=3381659 RepID=UPI003892155C